jgi:hypothetical protein
MSCDHNVYDAIIVSLIGLLDVSIYALKNLKIQTSSGQ